MGQLTPIRALPYRESAGQRERRLQQEIRMWEQIAAAWRLPRHLETVAGLAYSVQLFCMDRVWNFQDDIVPLKMLERKALERLHGNGGDWGVYGESREERAELAEQLAAEASAELFAMLREQDEQRASLPTTDSEEAAR